MALTSIGYDGTVDELGFAQMMLQAGHRHVVASRAAYAATQVSGSRAVSIAPGAAYTPGVLTTSDSAVTVNIPAPSAGQWYLIVLRRAWDTNSATIEAITQASAAFITTTARPNTVPTVYPSGFNSSPGTRDDQPLYWAWVNNSAVAVNLVDLRNLPASVPRVGTTAQRDAYYGVPTLNMQFSAMDGKTWENTEYNRTERFFGFGSSVHPGWYPVGGMMPAIRATKTSGATIGAGAAIIVWTDTTYYNGDDFIGFTPGSTTFLLKRTGLYRITFRAALGGPVIMIQRGLVNNAVIPTINHDTPGNANAYPKATLTDLFRFEAGDTVRFDLRAAGGSADMDLPQCAAVIEFVSPRLT